MGTEHLSKTGLLNPALLSGTGLPDPALLSLMAQALLHPDGPEVLHYVLKGKKGQSDHTIHYFARHDLVIKLVSDPENNLNLIHYDHNLGVLPAQVNLLLGEENHQDTRWKILAAALNHGVKVSRKETANVTGLARVLAQDSLKAIKADTGVEANLVRDYGYIIPYLFAKEFVGLTPVTKPSFLFRVFALLRNWRDGFGHKRRRSDKLRTHGRNASANEYLFWSHLIFGQIFGNYGLRNKAMTFIAGLMSKSFSKQVLRSIRDRTPSQGEFFKGGTLIERLHMVRGEFVGESMSDQEYDLHAKNLVFEIIASFHILIGISFGHLIDLVFRHNMDLKALAQTLGKKDGHFLIDRIIAENPTTALLFRTASNPIPQYGIAKGDGLCFLINEASKSLVGGCPVSPIPRHSVGLGGCPHIPTPNDRKAFLNFGPNEDKPYELVAGGKRSPKSANDIAHPCFGQYWARAILAEMFIALADEEAGLSDMEPADGAGAGVKNFAGIPDSFIVRYKS